MIHVTPEEALQLFADIKAERFLAIHWGTFDMTEEPVEEPPLRLEAEAHRLGLDLSKVWVLKHGDPRMVMSRRSGFLASCALDMSSR